MSSLTLLLMILTGILQCSAGGLLIHVDKDGADTAECIGGEKSCLTVNYALTKLQDRERDQPPVEVIVSPSQQKFPCQGIYDFNFTSLTITGVGDVTFSGLFGMTFEPDVKNVFVQIKGIKFENCRPEKPPSDPFNPGVAFIFIETFIFEDCTVHYGSSLFVRVQNLTIDSCVFSDFSSSALPVITSWVSVPGSMFSKSIRKSLPTLTKGNSKIGSIVVRNSVITNNTGTYTGPSDDYPGPGYMLVDVSGLPLDQYFDITHYDILIENCNFTNNSFTGKTTPLLYSNYADNLNFSADFNLVNSNFINNSITIKKGEYGFDTFPLLSLSMNTNTLFSFTVMECIFINNSFPPSVMLGYQNLVNVELNVLDSIFQSKGVPQGLHVIQDLTGKSTNNITTKFSGNKLV